MELKIQCETVLEKRLTGEKYKNVLTFDQEYA